MPTTSAKHRVYIGLAAGFAALGVVVGQLLVGADVEYSPAPDVSVFAVFYVLAQGVERTVEFVINGLALLDKGSDSDKPRFAEAKKRAALRSIRADSAPSAGDAKTLEDARGDLALFSQGLAFALAYSLVSYFEFGIFKTIGVMNMADGADRALTALAVAGGSKGLHDLISKIQKSKEAEEAKAT